MIPKKSNELYKEVAEDLEISADLVEDLVQLYYKEIRKNLTGLKYPRINVDGLGQFVAKTAKIRKAIPEIKTRLESHDTSTFNAYFHKKMLEEKIECLENLNELIKEEEQKKLKIEKLKDEYTKKNMEK